MIDGRSPWAFDPAKVVGLLKTLSSAGAAGVRVQASCPLQFVPWDLSCEEGLAKKVGGDVLAFAVQKIAEIVALADAIPFIVNGKEVRFSFFLSNHMSDR